MNERLGIWQAARDRIAAGILHDRIDGRKGSELLALCDERIREHRDGVVPDAEPAPAPAAATNVTTLRPRAAEYKATLQRRRQLRAQAIVNYDKTMRARGYPTRSEADAHVDRRMPLAMRATMPSACLWMLDLPGEGGSNE